MPRLSANRGGASQEWFSGFVVQLRLFDPHVLEFAGLKDLAAFQALYEFKVLIAGDDLHLGVLTVFLLVLLSGICTAELGS